MGTTTDQTRGVKTPSTEKPVSKKNASRRCAASRRRTIATVRRAVTSWCRIFGQQITFEPQSENCAELLKEVKKFLANCPSPVEEHRMAFQSIKKLLPPSCKCLEGEMLQGLIQGMLRPGSSLPDGYLAFARRVIRQLFPEGWDTTYRDHCYSTSPPLTSTFEHSRSEGGCTEIGMDQDEFLQIALGAQQGDILNVCKPMVVQSAGKPRPLTKYSERCLVLKPLHKAIYDRLSCNRWLSRGDVTDETLRKAGFVKGAGGLVSGDYKSATDNLPLSVASALLDELLETATRVPDGVRDHARRLLRPLVLYQSEEYEVTSGQQMGSLLSFPLLCIQNYVAFRWAIENFRPDGFPRFLPKDLPLLINGDDILFQTPDPRFYTSWVSVVQRVGLEVELTKTSFADDFGSLNSTLFRWRGLHLHVIPTARFGMLRSSDFVNSIAANMKSFVSGLGRYAYEAARQFLTWHRPSIIRSGLTLRELGFSGRLVWKVANVMKLQRVALRDKTSHGSCLPPAPTLHNFVLQSEDVEQIPEEWLSEEGKQASVREMTSWKWSKCRTFKKSGSVLSYLARLSRGPLDWASLCFTEYDILPKRFGSRLTRDPLQDEKRLYFSVRPTRVKCRPFFRTVERLPSYQEIAGDALERGDTLCPYAQHRARRAGDKWALKQWQ